MAGYWRNPQATSNTLRDGWLYTGDMGMFDDDGFLTLKDRSKDLIISGSSNIYPREVEEVLLMHPAIAEVAIVGQRDPEWGEVPVAFVAFHPQQQANPAELDAWCVDNLARFKRPRHYQIIDALPKNSYGKVLKTALRDRLESEPIGQASAARWQNASSTLTQRSERCPFFSTKLMIQCRALRRALSSLLAEGHARHSATAECLVDQLLDSAHRSRRPAPRHAEVEQERDAGVLRIVSHRPTAGGRAVGGS